MTNSTPSPGPPDRRQEILKQFHKSLEGIFSTASFMKALPGFTVLGILFGYLRVSAYYSLFGIDIASHLDASEILLHFAGVAIPVVTVILLYITIEVASILHLIYPRHVEIGVVIFIFLFNLVVLNMMRLYGMESVLTLFDEFPLWFVGGFIFAVAIQMGCAIVALRFPVYESTLLLIALLLVLQGLFYLDSYTRHWLIVHKGRGEEITLELESGRTIKSDKNLVYVGATQNFHFFYDLSDSKNIAVTKSAVLKESHANRKTSKSWFPIWQW